MSHLEDRLAEFVFQDLPKAEMEHASRHVAQCLECQQKVQSFQKTLGLLERIPGSDVPRRMVFVASPSSSDRRSAFDWARLAWGLPSGVAALLLLAVLVGGGVSVDWSEGFQVAFGTQGPRPVVVESAAADVDYEQLDYERIASELSASYGAAIEDMRSELVRMRVELERFDDFDSVEIQRLRAEIQNLYNQNQLVQRNIYDQNAAVQQIASRLE